MFFFQFELKSQSISEQLPPNIKVQALSKTFVYNPMEWSRIN